MPRIVDAEQQRREIRQAARRVFARRGVSGTGLAHVASAAGMGRSSLYHYYPDKASLVRDLAAELLAEEQALFSALARAPGSPLARIEQLVEALGRSVEETARVGRVLLELCSRESARLRPLFRSLRRDLAALIAEGQARGEVDAELDPELAAALVIGCVDGLLLQKLVDPAAFSDSEALRATLLTNVRRLLAA